MLLCLSSVGRPGEVDQCWAFLHGRLKKWDEAPCLEVSLAESLEQGRA